MGVILATYEAIASMYGIFTYIYHILLLKATIHVGKCTSPMDGIGKWDDPPSTTPPKNLPGTKLGVGVGWLLRHSRVRLLVLSGCLNGVRWLPTLSAGGEVLELLGGSSQDGRK